MKHIKTFESFLNEGKRYQNEDEIIADALDAFNRKFGTKLTMGSFDSLNEVEGTKRFETNDSAKKDLNKLMSSPDWNEDDTNYDSLELDVNLHNQYVEIWKIDTSSYKPVTIGSWTNKKGIPMKKENIFSFPR